jgi:hypothetical protein
MTSAATCLALLLLVPPSASATEQIWNTGWSNYTSIESELCGSPALDNEAADDFDVVGTIERVYVTGNNACIAVCFPPPVTGVRVRFFEWTAAGPGALQSEQFVPAGGPGLAYDPSDIEDLDVTLPQPFFATGRHYVSVQLQFADCFWWGFWVANKDAPLVGPAYRRANGGAWTKATAFGMQSCDLSFKLFGTLGPPAAPQGCGTWVAEPSPDAPGTDQNWLHGLAWLAPDDIWAVGRSYGQFTASDWNQETLALHFDGSAWSVVPTPNPSPAPELTWCTLDAIAALAPDDIWAAGSRQAQDACFGYVGLHNLVLHWDGSAWQVMDAPLPPCFGAQGVSGDSIHDILALAPDDIWFFGEWITMNAQGVTWRPALAMHWDGSDFSVTEVPVVGAGGATIYAADAAGPDDIWAVGASGDGDPAASSPSYIYHWDGQDWSHVPAPPAPGLYHTLGGVEVLAPDDVWISGSAWAPPDVVTPFMLHWDGSRLTQVQVPYAGGLILGAPPAMYVFGSGGVSVFDGAAFSDAHLLEGLEALSGFGFGDVVQTGPCEMLAVGSQSLAGDAHTLVARLVPLSWPELGFAKAGSFGPPHLTGAGSLVAGSSNLLGLTGASPATVATLVLGLVQLAAPFKGGTLVPAPALLLPLPTDAAGAAALPFTWPAGLPPGTEIFFQTWIPDAGASHGLSASNGLKGVSG